MVGQVQTSSDMPIRRPWLPQSSLLYEDEYIWLAVLSGIDVVLMTLYVQWGGRLISPLVDEVLMHTGMLGLLSAKLVIVALMVMCCETLGRRRPNVGRKVITVFNLFTLAAVAILTYELVLMHF